MGTAKKALNIVINTLLWILVIIIAFFSIITFSTKGDGNVASLAGYTPMTVLTESMAPTFEKDDLIIVRKGDANTYQIGDVISFWTVIDNKRVVNTHRIVNRIETGSSDSLMVQFETAGDNNNGVVDPLIVSGGDIIGKYQFKVPFLGKVLGLLSSSVGFFLIIVLPLLAFFLYQLYRLINLMLQLKRATILEATREAMAQAQAEAAGGKSEALPEAEDKTNQKDVAE